MDYQLVRSTETSAASGVQERVTMVGESAQAANHAHTLFHMKPRVYVIKTVVVFDATGLPAAVNERLVFVQVGTRFTLKRVQAGADNILSVALTDARDKNATAPPVNVVTDTQDKFEVFDGNALHWMAWELNAAPDAYGDPSEEDDYRRDAKFQALLKFFEVVD